MAGESEPAKLLQPYLQRAEELKNHEPLVAYYCRLYAMEKGLKIPPGERTKTTNSLLVSLIKQLEKDKTSLKLGSEDNLHVEGFALNIFAKADKKDRAGRADKNTAKSFYAAGIFFEILTQFGPLQPDLEQKQKYALWKCGEISKALKEGRRPTPGPPEDNVPNPNSVFGQDSDLNDTPHDLPPQDVGDVADDRVRSIAPGYGGNEYNPPPPPPPPDHSTYMKPPYNQSYVEEDPYKSSGYAPSEPGSYSYPNFQSYPSFSDSFLPSAPSHSSVFYNSSPPVHPPAQAPVHVPSQAPSKVPIASPAYAYDDSYHPPPEKIAEAHKAARLAVGALAFDDVSIAVDYLKKSLELLTMPNAGK